MIRLRAKLVCSVCGVEFGFASTSDELEATLALAHAHLSDNADHSIIELYVI